LGRRHPPLDEWGSSTGLAAVGQLSLARLIDSLFRTLRIYHFKLGEMAAL